MTDYIQKQIFGTTTTTVINTATDIAASNFSGAPAATFDNTTDATVPYAPLALAVAQFPDWGGVPAANGTVELWGILQNTDGTSDDTDAPSGATQNAPRFFGSWIIAPADALQRRSIVINLEGVKQVDFYIKNATNQNMNNDAGTNCVVKVTPLSYGVTV